MLQFLQKSVNAKSLACEKLMPNNLQSEKRISCSLLLFTLQLLKLQALKEQFMKLNKEISKNIQFTNSQFSYSSLSDF